MGEAMADKNLDELMKDLNTYTVQVAEEKKKAQAEAYKEPFIFPWKWVILAIIGLGWYFRKPIETVTFKVVSQPQVRQVLDMLDQSSQSNPELKGPSSLELKNELLSGKDVSTSLPSAPTDVRMPATAPERDIVQIEGKWYKKSPDNVYYIKGRRILYIDKVKNSATEAPQ